MSEDYGKHRLGMNVNVREHRWTHHRLVVAPFTASLNEMFLLIVARRESLSTAPFCWGWNESAQPVKSLRPTASDVGALLEFSATVSDSASIETSKTEFKLRMPREPPPNYTLSMANNLQPFQRERSIMASLSVATVQLQEIKWKI